MPPERCLVKQPKALQNLALDKVAIHICSVVDGNSLKLFLDLYDHDPVQAENLLNRKIEIMRNELENTLPWMYYDELADIVLRRLLLLFKDQNFNYHPSHKYIIGRTMDIFYTNRLTSLVFPNVLSDPFGEYLQFLLYSRADYLTGLTHLRLSSSIESDIIRLIPKFHSLKSIVIDVGSDTILNCIDVNCKFIESLNILSDREYSESYRGIADFNVYMLYNVQNLKSIKLYNTAVTKTGFAMLLSTCKNLERIVVMDIDLIQPLQYLINSNGFKHCGFKYGAEPPFKLKFYNNITTITLEQLQVVFKMCPQIEDLRIRGGHIRDLSALADAKYLKALSLFSYNFYENLIGPLLKVTGQTLVKLFIFNTELDLNAVRLIYETCPKMESLELSYCYNMSNQQILQKNYFTQHKCLEKISFEMKSYEFTQTKDPVIFLLSNCPNIKYIELDFPARVIDDVLLEVINKNPRSFTKLETLVITGTLKEELLNRIVSNCNNPIEIINKPSR